MQDSQVPSKIPTPFGSNAGVGFINPIPPVSQIGVKNGAASFPDGFPPLTFTALSAGGAGPFGADFNGLLNQVTAILQWFQAGGPVTYDSAFQATIGGYPANSVIQSAQTPGLFWYSTIDNNVNNPDAGGAGWVPFLQPISTIQLGAFANKFYNATCQIAQRGVPITVSPGSPAYTLDGYIVGCLGNSVTVTQGPSIGNAANSLQITGQAGVTDVWVIKPIESVNAGGLNNVPNIFQVKFVNNTGSILTPTITVKTALAGTDNWGSATTVINNANLPSANNGVTTQLFYPFKMSPNAGNGVSVRVDMGNSLNGNGKFVQLGDWDIRAGTALVLPELRIYSQELLECQRYLPSLDAAGISSHMYFGSGGNFSSGNAGGVIIPFYTRARAAISAVVYSNLSDFNINYRGALATLTSLIFDSNNIGPFYAVLDFTSLSTAANPGEFTNLIAITGNARMYFTGAELNGLAI